MTADVTSWPVEAARKFCDSRERASARETYGAPFVAAPETHALVVRDRAPAEPAGALIFTIAGGVAEIDLLAAAGDPGQLDDALVKRFEETASYNNCHKMIARVKSGGCEQRLLERAGFRVAGRVERHFFQAEFVDLVKWLM